MLPVLPMIDVREDLARATAPAHLALHDHRWIGQLAAPGLSREVYRGILTAYRIVHEEVEDHRNATGLFEPLSLAPAVAALRADLDVLGPFPHPIPPPRDTELSAAGLLGALYVLHGAGFGARSLRAGAARNLTGAPLGYLTLGTSPALWRRLKTSLQDLAEDPPARARLERGARDTFGRVGETVSHICEGATTVDAGAVFPPSLH
ncbi:biliverdin-producing heme oxygenase [Marimonas sp. MJW-29]|uniref:Biliverdin-producing heme oxygenase n=1 Tax=Sulfitobacter sediminis TaxID=3234186 RepID=A0ABV3RMV4_9RHOB